MIIEMSWQVNGEVSRDMAGEADGKNQGVDSTDGVMHIWMSDLCGTLLMTRRHFQCHQLSFAEIVSVYVCDSILNSHQISTSWYWFCHHLSRTTIICFIRKHCRSNRHGRRCADRLGDVLYGMYSMLSIVRAFSSHRLVGLLCWQYFPHSAMLERDLVIGVVSAPVCHTMVVSQN